ncbi:MAG: hypothetical protein AB8E15_06425 [Bdellovibrionales bacterium]
MKNRSHLFLIALVLMFAQVGSLWSSECRGKYEDGREYFESINPKKSDSKDKDGVVATEKEVGLTAKAAIEAYPNAIFPWNPGKLRWWNFKLREIYNALEARKNEPRSAVQKIMYYLQVLLVPKPNHIRWYSPLEQGMIPTKPISKFADKMSSTRKKALKHVIRELGDGEKGNKKWFITYNQAFGEVVYQSSIAKRDKKKYGHVWLIDDVQLMAKELQRQGKAYSVEVWNKDGDLVGGQYFFFIKNVVAGESMFMKEPNSAKAAVFDFADILYQKGIEYIYTQTLNSNSVQNYKAVPLKRDDVRDYFKELAQKEPIDLKNPFAAQTEKSIDLMREIMSPEAFQRFLDQTK